MRTLRYVLCDVFTQQPLAGNPLAVFTDARGLSRERMQGLARELNLSETTFVTPPESGGTARVRIFTPRSELPFAGHPTLGTAAVLGGPLERPELTLELGVGPVRVTLNRDSQTGDHLVAAFSRPAPSEMEGEDVTSVLAALSLPASGSSVALYDNGGLRHLVVAVPEPGLLDRLEPDLVQLARLPCDTIDVCSRTHDGARLRVFAPKHGIVEDPATGSAVGPVTWHWHRLGQLDTSRLLRIEQGQQLGRPSELQGRIHGLPEEPQVEVSGAVVIVARGEFRLP